VLDNRLQLQNKENFVSSYLLRAESFVNSQQVGLDPKMMLMIINGAQVDNK
jgi:hypothetical protein